VRVEPPPADLARYYAPEYYGSREAKFTGPMEALVRRQSKWHHLKFERVARELYGYRRVLDVGCGTGALAEALDATLAAHLLREETGGYAFAHALVREARRGGVGWALLLGLVRAEGGEGARPATVARLREDARRLARSGHRGRWSSALAVTGETSTADQVAALARYYRAVGLRTLVDGLEASRDRLARKLLRDDRHLLAAGGRSDLGAERIDVRVLALVEYLAESYGQVTVSSLKAGHRIYSRPGVVSAHTYGQAVDIAALANLPIAGHQEPGGLTERAVRDILLLPAEMLPRQVISLLGLGGPSFPLANHDDHIHVGF